MAILFALIALVGWAVGDIIIAVASRKMGNRPAYFWWLVFGSLISLLYVPFAGPLTDFGMFGIAFLIGSLMAFGTLFYFKGFEVGNASIVGTMGGAYAMITVPLSMVLFGERLTPFQIFGILCIFIGLIITSLRSDAIKEIQSGKIVSDKGALFGGVAMVLWGISWALERYPIEKIGWFWTGLPSWFFFVVLLLLGRIKRKDFLAIKKKGTIPILIAAASITCIGSYAFNIGMSLGFTSIVAPIAGLSPVLFVIIAYFVFHDRLDRQQFMGIILSLFGIAIVAFS